MAIPPNEPLLAQCANVLLSGQPPDRQPPEIRSLLKALEYATDDPEPLNRHRAALLRAAAGFTRLFRLRPPEAPGLIVFGAEVDPSFIDPGGLGQRPLPASGLGLSFRSAFESCVGEGIELLSQFESTRDSLFHATPAECEASHTVISHFPPGMPPDSPLGWITAQHALARHTVAIPADLCLRRGSGHGFTPPWPLSIGCAAGPSPEAAMLHGLLELIERDAAALWWRGGQRGRLIPLDGAASRHAIDLLTRIRRATQRRRSWLLDITTDLAVPCVASLSVTQDGRGFACGLAARLTLTQATEAAILEMCQMELAHQVIAAKRSESGDDALNAIDRAHIRRATDLDLNTCLLLHPMPSPAGQMVEIETNDIASALRHLTEHLAGHAVETFTIDLTRPAYGVPVMRMVCPALEKEPSPLIGDRLQTSMRRTGGGHQYTNGIPLM